MPSLVFDFRKLFKDLDTKRRRHTGLSWHRIATRVGMTPSGLHQFVASMEDAGAAPKKLALENTLNLMLWLGKTDFKEYMVDDDDLE